MKITQWKINKLLKALGVIEAEMTAMLGQHEAWLLANRERPDRWQKWGDYSARWKELGETLAEGRRVLALANRARSKGKPILGYGPRDLEAFLERMNR